MLRLLLTRRWVAMTVLLLACLVAFAILGRWQLGRAGRVGDGPSPDPAPVALAGLLRAGDPPSESTVGRRVTVAGRYVAAEQLLVPGQREGGREGFWVMTPLTSDSGDVVPVVRGFVFRVQDATAAPSGAVDLAGRVQPPQPFGTLDRALPAGQVGSVSPADLAGRVNGRMLQGYVVLTGARPAEALPAVTPTVLPHHGRPLRLQNLAYALQWWFFAGFAVFWYLRMLRDEAHPVPRVPASELAGSVPV